MYSAPYKRLKKTQLCMQARTQAIRREGNLIGWWVIIKELTCVVFQSVQQGSLRPDHGDVGVSSTTGTQSVESKIWDIQ